MLTVEQLRQPHFPYLIVVSAIGLFLVAQGFWQIPTYHSYTTLILFVILAVASQIATTSSTIFSKVGITYSIVSAVSMATVLFFGPFSATLVESASIIAVWVLKPSDKTFWKKNWSQLFFNNGMSAIAIFVAGTVFLFLRESLPHPILSETIPWIVGAIIYDQVNLWLLIGIITLQNKGAIKPFEFWRSHSWSTRVMLIITSVGGALLAFALQEFGTIGIVIFFLPIFFSAYTIRLYIRQMESYMENLENMVEARTQELVDLNQRKDQFLAVLTHDMKAPLTGIRLCAEMILEEPNIVIENPKHAQRILQGQETLLEMVNNILDFEKLESGDGLDLEKDVYDLPLLASDVTYLMQSEADKKEMTLSLICHPDSISLLVEMDIAQIRRVLTNLISNAIKYSPEKTSITVHIRSEKNMAVVDVIDTGYGIPEESLPYIFDRFHRVEKLKNRASGTGLGLAIAKALIEAHNGQVHVVSEEGKGSTFTMVLPRYMQQDEVDE